MIRAIRILLFVFLMTTPFALAQEKPATLTPKDTEASKELTKLAKDQQADQKAISDAFQQAKSSLDQNQKALNDELQKSQKDLDDKLAADKKYKDAVAHIESLKKQITDLGQKAQQEFNARIGTLQSKYQMEGAQLQAFITVVRRENGWPDTATFDPATGKWSEPAKK